MVQTMIDFFSDFFGVYTPVTYSQGIYDSSGSLLETVDVIPDGLAGVDWTYVLAVAGFFIVLYGVLRIIGGVIKRG